MAEVKAFSPRTARRERARATRSRMLAAAFELFVRQGYAPTTMGQIAAAAGVAVQTVHFTFHTKAELLQEVLTKYAAGEEDPDPVMERPWMKEALATPNPYRQLALLTDHGIDIYKRMAPLTPALQAAASVDGQVAALMASIAAARRSGMAAAIEALARKGSLREGLDVKHATDLMVVLNSHETFLGLAVGAGWSVEQFKAWLYLTLCEQLLAPAGAADLVAATAGLSYHEQLSRTKKGSGRL
ncbi:MAG TPA: helix-turn-helix domain-containing protein [Candidatus Nitrosotalea sp.]|nr:helix-turn-helix domain-containing protein [Candidatus Nitrosotalea sp.]